MDKSASRYLEPRYPPSIVTTLEQRANDIRPDPATFRDMSRQTGENS